MKLPRNVPPVPGVAIALCATVLGFMIAVNFAPRLLTYRNWMHVFGPSALDILWIGIVAIVVLGLVFFKSITDRRYQTDRDLLEAFLEHIPDNVFFKDRDSRFVRISRAMADYCGLTHPTQAVSKTDADIFSSEHASVALADEKDIIRTGEPIVGVEEKETWPDGRESWVLTTKVPLYNRRGQITGTMGIARNITDRKLAEAKIHHMALHDALTGLPNRILLEERLAQATSLACSEKTEVAVMMLDLDRFKDINDSFGHHTGDRLLEAVSRRLAACLRGSDIIARLSGDEFIIGASISHGVGGSVRVAQKLLAALVEPIQIDGRDLRISASIGICQYPADGENPEVLLQAADAALHEAKKMGRGSYCFFEKELTEKSRNRRKLENDLLFACARGEFVLYYQPMVSALTGLITGVEALLRWQHPEHGLIPPGQFIPYLEELGLMAEVGQWVLRTACIQNLAWQKEGLAPIRVAVNLSAQQFYRGDIVNAVDQALRETGLDARWLELELTETLTLDASENTVSIMHDLKRIGVSLSLDDFGTGWSSLSYLSRFPLDRLKIDRSFLRDIATRPAARAVVGSIINLGRSLNLDCIGEGVETRQQLDYLREQKCSEIQGFLYSPPLPAADCRTLLRFGGLGFDDGPSILGTRSNERGYDVLSKAPSFEVALQK